MSYAKRAATPSLLGCAATKVILFGFRFGDLSHGYSGLLGVRFVRRLIVDIKYE